MNSSVMNEELRKKHKMTVCKLLKNFKHLNEEQSKKG
jgi:hypothetical protein